MTDKHSIQAEIASVQGFLEQIPLENVIDRMSFEARVEILREELLQAQTKPDNPAVSVFFDGPPVIGSRGIECGFAGKVLQLYAEAVQSKAADIDGKLKDGGQVPMRSQHELFFIHKQAGSFGFALEAARPDLDSADAERLKKAIKSVEGLIDGSLKGDRELASATHSTQWRVIRKVKQFMHTCSEARTLFRIGQEKEFIKPDSLVQLADAVRRLEGTKREETLILAGVLSGVVGGKRTFELTIEPGDAKGAATQADSAISTPKQHHVRGGIDRAIDHEQVKSLKDLLWKNCEATLKLSQVRQTKSYRLLSIKLLDETPGDA